MDKIVLMAKLNALKDVEIWLNEQYIEIQQELNKLEEKGNE